MTIRADGVTEAQPFQIRQPGFLLQVGECACLLGDWGYVAAGWSVLPARVEELPHAAF